jgi:hypothetical protein
MATLLGRRVRDNILPGCTGIVTGEVKYLVGSPNIQFEYLDATGAMRSSAWVDAGRVTVIDDGIIGEG